MRDPSRPTPGPAGEPVATAEAGATTAPAERVAANPSLPEISVLARLQQGLESLYRVETKLDVRCFVVSDRERDRTLNDNAVPARRPREQLLVTHAGGEVSLGLYLDAAALANLERHDPGQGLSEVNFGDFCLAVEGVSHFIYVAWCAAADRLVTALELELQAEIDKFVSCALLHRGSGNDTLSARLFEDVRYAHDLDEEERTRYATANDEARRYARSLERRYLNRQQTGDMLAELRRFYRLSLDAKLSHIAAAAAA